MMPLIQIGLLLYGALYCAGVFVAGVVWGKTLAIVLILACAGVTYFSYFAHIYGATRGNPYSVIRIINGLVIAGIVLGILAGAKLFI